jgi:AraC-like DNA-binding protein
MNTNDFKPLDYLNLNWDLSEDYTVKRSGQMQLPPVAPYESIILNLDTGVDAPVSGAEYFVNLHFFDEFGNEVAYKQVSLGILKPKTDFVSEPEDLQIQEQEGSVSLIGKNLRIAFTRGMLSYVENHFTDADISLRKLADIFSYTEKYLSHLFKKNMGVNFNAYLTKMRIEYAVKCIAGGMRSIAEIAELCGYYDALYFSKVFKRVMGETPLAYMKRAEEATPPHSNG